MKKIIASLTAILFAAAIFVTASCGSTQNAQKSAQTENEWETAAKGGQNYKYAGSDNLDEVGWYDDNSGNTTHPVAQKKPNGYGVYDMSGNVWEWCWDSSGNYRVLRGGSWYNFAGLCEVALCSYDYPNNRNKNYGFRGVCTVRKSEK